MKKIAKGMHTLKIMLTMHTTFAVLCLMVTACATVESVKELPTAESVDLSRYIGKWYEIARLPMWAQRNCLRSVAEYTFLESDDIGVKNTCASEDGGETSIEGIAKILDQEHGAKLDVVFDQWAAKIIEFYSPPDNGNYWILKVDPDYQYAVVGTPDREYLWILARTPSLPEDTYQELVAFSQRLGFTTQNLIRASPSSSK